MRLLRSCLAVPAGSAEKLRKAAGLAVDAVVVDLEDAVAAGDKQAARDLLSAEWPSLEFRAPTVLIRVNGRRTPWFERDVALVSELRPQLVVVPKVESADDLAGLPVPAHALIETARGLVEVERIAASPVAEALVFGPGDFAASLGAPSLTIGEGDWLYPLTRIVVAARAFGLQALDGPFVRLGDEDGLRASAQRARALGYDGKWAIHPEQVAPLQEVFAATDAEVEQAERILEAAAGGAARHDGAMVDEATVRMAEALLARRSPV
ncbi:MAG TPA: CoA ester lyase [Gaiellaceae bacterium]|nr:CoA ester lyase [Gaiellaceae bacterium]